MSAPLLVSATKDNQPRVQIAKKWRPYLEALFFTIVAKTSFLLLLRPMSYSSVVTNEM